MISETFKPPRMDKFVLIGEHFDFLPGILYLVTCGGIGLNFVRLRAFRLTQP